ncbi:MAG: hypothetical protein GXP51_06385, partial [Deltaproteobacteria bacterium]|nr:hypothetical protein [Deltaproteobacteria bacterium]
SAADDAVAGGQCSRKRKKIGQGIASTPGIHTGRERGSRVLLQTSGGAIVTIEQDSTGPTKSGMIAWEVEH